MGVPSKNSSVLDIGRRPELKSEGTPLGFFEGTPLIVLEIICTFVLETAQESGFSHWRRDPALRCASIAAPKAAQGAVGRSGSTGPASYAGNLMIA